MLVLVDDSEPDDGDEVVVLLLLLELPPPEGEGFTIVVFVSDLSASAGAPGVTVSVFC